jgi:hypothetical protein
LVGQKAYCTHFVDVINDQDLAATWTDKHLMNPVHHAISMADLHLFRKYWDSDDALALDNKGRYLL